MGFGIGKTILGIQRTDNQANLAPNTTDAGPNQQRNLIPSDSQNANIEGQKSGNPISSSASGNKPFQLDSSEFVSKSDREFGQSINKMDADIQRLKQNHGPVFDDLEFENISGLDNQIRELTQLIERAELNQSSRSVLGDSNTNRSDQNQNNFTDEMEKR